MEARDRLCAQVMTQLCAGAVCGVARAVTCQAACLL
jgi:hypothetical protein